MLWMIDLRIDDLKIEEFCVCNYDRMISLWKKNNSRGSGPFIHLQWHFEVCFLQSFDSISSRMEGHWLSPLIFPNVSVNFYRIKCFDANKWSPFHFRSCACFCVIQWEKLHSRSQIAIFVSCMKWNGPSLRISFYDYYFVIFELAHRLGWHLANFVTCVCDAE